MTASPLVIFPFCRLLLMNDASYPWFILVPRREGVREIFELGEDEQRQLLRESSTLSRHIAEYFRADKMNVAAPWIWYRNCISTILPASQMIPPGLRLYGAGSCQSTLFRRGGFNARFILSCTGERMSV